MTLLHGPYCAKVLVLGGSGFIGSRLVAQLAAQGRSILLPTRRAINARHLITLPSVEVVEADIHDEATLAQLMGAAVVPATFHVIACALAAGQVTALFWLVIAKPEPVSTLLILTSLVVVAPIASAPLVA